MKDLFRIFIVIFSIGFFVGLILGAKWRSFVNSDSTIANYIYANTKAISNDKESKVVLFNKGKQLVNYDFKENTINEDLLHSIQLENSMNLYNIFIEDIDFLKVLSAGFGGWKLKDFISNNKGSSLKRTPKSKKTIIGIIASISGVYIGFKVSSKEYGSYSNQELKDHFIKMFEKDNRTFKKNLIRSILHSYGISPENQATLDGMNNFKQIEGPKDFLNKLKNNMSYPLYHNSIDSITGINQFLLNNKKNDSISNSELYKNLKEYKEDFFIAKKICREKTNMQDITLTHFKAVFNYYDSRIKFISNPTLNKTEWNIINFNW